MVAPYLTYGGERDREREDERVREREREIAREGPVSLSC
jgi:hypothetical protein